MDGKKSIFYNTNCKQSGDGKAHRITSGFCPLCKERTNSEVTQGPGILIHIATKRSTHHKSHETYFPAKNRSFVTFDDVQLRSDDLWRKSTKNPYPAFNNY